MAEGRLYWRGAAEDEAMQDAHGFVWTAMLDTVDVDLAGKRVLDAGCNRGGFLCLLSDACGIAEGCGYDPASGAIDDARRLAGPRPLRFEVADSVPAGWGNFDVAFSHPRVGPHRRRRRRVFSGLRGARALAVDRVLQRPQAPDAMHTAGRRLR